MSAPQPLRVFLVDDEQPARNRMREVLGDLAGELPNVVVGEAANGQEAIAALPGLAADVVLVTLNDFGGPVTLVVFVNPLGTRYDANGGVLQLGTGFIHTLTQAEFDGGAATNPYGLQVGEALVKYIAPGKYGIKAVAPTGSSWVQTSTIEGTPVIDVWVMANEPAYFMEFGPPGYQASSGFVRPMQDATVLTGGSTISGQVVNLHMSRPPGPFYNGAPLAHTTAWVGLNAGPPGAGRGVFAAAAAPDGAFASPRCPARHLSARDLGRGAGPDLRVPRRHRQRRRLLPLAQRIVRARRGARFPGGGRGRRRSP